MSGLQCQNCKIFLDKNDIGTTHSYYQGCFSEDRLEYLCKPCSKCTVCGVPNIYLQFYNGKLNGLCKECIKSCPICKDIIYTINEENNKWECKECKKSYSEKAIDYLKMIVTRLI